MITNDIDNLLARYFAGELSPQDEVKLDEWLAMSADNEAYFFELTSLYQNIGGTDCPKIDIEAAFSKMQGYIDHSLEEERPSLAKRNRKIMISVSAIAAAIVGVFVLLNVNRKDVYKTITEKQIYTLANETQIDLLDGEIQYSEDPEQDTIFLKGTAKFKMESEKTGSKIVKTGDVYIKDIGTAFTVYASTPDSVYVTVTEGEVLFYSDNNSGVKLKVRESGYYLSKNKKFHKIFATGSFDFKTTSLNDLVNRLKDYYGYQITLHDERLKDLSINVAFKEENLATILDIISTTLNLTVQYTDDGYLITS